MPELIVDFITSLDGYGAAEGWPGWWGLQGPEYLGWLAEVPERDYTILMGANTYRLMSAMEGETSDEEASVSELASASKVVFSSTLQPPLAWPNTRLISGDAVGAVRQMKQEGNASLRTIGSLSLCRSLLKAGLVDRFRVVVFPVITGSTGSDWIYEGYPDVALDMVASQRFDGRIQLLEYVPRVLTAPPGANNGS
jgi:dihydrofolate reductase